MTGYTPKTEYVLMPDGWKWNGCTGKHTAYHEGVWDGYHCQVDMQREDNDDNYKAGVIAGYELWINGGTLNVDT